MAIDVRPATTGDLAAVRQLLGHLHDQPSDVAWSSATWGRILGDPNRTVLVAEDRGEFPVGTADVLIVPNLTHDGAPWAIVENVVVDPQWRRRGGGRALLKHAVRPARPPGSYHRQLPSLGRHAGALRVCERAGLR